MSQQHEVLGAHIPLNGGITEETFRSIVSLVPGCEWSHLHPTAAPSRSYLGVCFLCPPSTDAAPSTGRSPFIRASTKCSTEREWQQIAFDRSLDQAGAAPLAPDDDSPARALQPPVTEAVCLCEVDWIPEDVCHGPDDLVDSGLLPGGCPVLVSHTSRCRCSPARPLTPLPAPAPENRASDAAEAGTAGVMAGSAREGETCTSRLRRAPEADSRGASPFRSSSLRKGHQRGRPRVPARSAWLTPRAAVVVMTPASDATTHAPGGCSEGIVDDIDAPWDPEAAPAGCRACEPLRAPPGEPRGCWVVILLGPPPGPTLATELRWWQHTEPPSLPHRMFLAAQLMAAMADAHERGGIIGGACLSLQAVFVAPGPWLTIHRRTFALMVALHRAKRAAPAADPTPRGEGSEPRHSASRAGDVAAMGGRWASVEDMTAAWEAGSGTTLGHILRLNLLAGRVRNSPAHPVVPWVSDVTRDPRANGGEQQGWRDLALSKWRVVRGDEQLRAAYRSSRPPHHVPAALLNGHARAMYLARVLPRAVLEAEVRRRVRAGDYPGGVLRLYQASPEEAIPEFYDDPTVLRSIHTGERASAAEAGSPGGDGPLALPDLQPPDWARGPEDFVRAHRWALESARVARDLPAWIDLHFGSRLLSSADLNVPARATREEVNAGVARTKVLSGAHPQGARRAEMIVNGIVSSRDARRGSSTETEEGMSRRGSPGACCCSAAGADAHLPQATDVILSVSVVPHHCCDICTADLANAGAAGLDAWPLSRAGMLESARLSMLVGGARAALHQRDIFFALPALISVLSGHPILAAPAPWDQTLREAAAALLPQHSAVVGTLVAGALSRDPESTASCALARLESGEAGADVRHAREVIASLPQGESALGRLASLAQRGELAALGASPVTLELTLPSLLIAAEHAAWGRGATPKAAAQLGDMVSALTLMLPRQMAVQQLAPAISRVAGGGPSAVASAFGGPTAQSSILRGLGVRVYCARMLPCLTRMLCQARARTSEPSNDASSVDSPRTPRAGTPATAPTCVAAGAAAVQVANELPPGVAAARILVPVLHYLRAGQLDTAATVAPLVSLVSNLPQGLLDSAFRVMVGLALDVARTNASADAGTLRVFLSALTAAAPRCGPAALRWALVTSGGLLPDSCSRTPAPLVQLASACHGGPTGDTHVPAAASWSSVALTVVAMRALGDASLLADNVLPSLVDALPRPGGQRGASSGHSADTRQDDAASGRSGAPDAGPWEVLYPEVSLLLGDDVARRVVPFWRQLPERDPDLVRGSEAKSRTSRSPPGASAGTPQAPRGRRGALWASGHGSSAPHRTTSLPDGSTDGSVRSREAGSQGGVCSPWSWYDAAALEGWLRQRRGQTGMTVGRLGAVDDGDGAPSARVLEGRTLLNWKAFKGAVRHVVPWEAGGWAIAVGSAAAAPQTMSAAHAARVRSAGGAAKSGLHPWPVEVRELATGAILHRHTGHRSAVTAAAAVHERLAATADVRGSLQLWGPSVHAGHGMTARAVTWGRRPSSAAGGPGGGQGEYVSALSTGCHEFDAAGVLGGSTSGMIFSLDCAVQHVTCSWKLPAPEAVVCLVPNALYAAEGSHGQVEAAWGGSTLHSPAGVIVPQTGPLGSGRRAQHPCVLAAATTGGSLALIDCRQPTPAAFWRALAPKMPSSSSPHSQQGPTALSWCDTWGVAVGNGAGQVLLFDSRRLQDVQVGAGAATMSAVLSTDAPGGAGAVLGIREEHDGTMVVCGSSAVWSLRAAPGRIGAGGVVDAGVVEQVVPLPESGRTCMGWMPLMACAMLGARDGNVSIVG
ncbi:unnamed protein product [Pedinophyceae sp. YPF-701]|nr:unnamed protein product [Pedinophyceae sp. YPF-701]